MKIDVNLQSTPQLILRIIHEAGGSIPFNKLSRAYHITSPLEEGFAAAISKYGSKFNSVPSLSELETLETEIEGLTYIGLLSKKVGFAYEQVKQPKKNSRSGKRTSKAVKIIKKKIPQPEIIKSVLLTEEGKRIAQNISENRRLIFRPKSSLQTTIFIACAFGRPEIDELSDRFFVPSCANLGYKPIRVDMSEPERTITELIMEEITQSAAMLADLTYARPSVYFEIGYAHGLGIPIVLTCRQDHYRGTKDDQRVHFDLEQYKISFWTKTGDGGITWQDQSMEPEKRLAQIIPVRD